MGVGALVKEAARLRLQAQQIEETAGHQLAARFFFRILDADTKLRERRLHREQTFHGCHANLQLQEFGEGEHVALSVGRTT